MNSSKPCSGSREFTEAQASTSDWITCLPKCMEGECRLPTLTLRLHRVGKQHSSYIVAVGFGWMRSLAHESSRCRICPLRLAASVLSRLNQKPYVFGQLSVLWGWIWSAVQGKPRYHDPEFRQFLRGYQRRALLVGKKRATEECSKNATPGTPTTP